jgi:uncharacterized protein
MKKAISFLATLIASATMSAAPGPSAAQADAPLSFATGSPDGVYYPIGATLAGLWTRQIDGLSVEAEPTGGSIANVRLVDSGEADLALVQNDIARYAFHGDAMFADGAPLDGYLAMAMLYPEPVQIVTLRESGIASVDDLEGRRVAVGGRASGTEFNARQILEAHGLDYGELKEFRMSFEEAVVALRDGNIHAAFVTAGVPTRAVANLVSLYGHDLSVVPINSERVDAILERWPFYTAMNIPSGTYAGVPEDVPTVTVRAMLVASAALDADIVERLLNVLYDDTSLRRLCRAHPRGCDIALESARAAMPIPLHPGAEQFYSGSN